MLTICLKKDESITLITSLNHLFEKLRESNDTSVKINNKKTKHCIDKNRRKYLENHK
jgi:hypothetical protein